MHRLATYTLPLLTLTMLMVPDDHLKADVGAELVRSNFQSAICNIDSMTISFKLDEAFGEPLATSKMQWRAGPNTDINCLSRLTHVWVRVRTPDDTIHYIKLNPEIVPSGAGFGPTATESPNWSNFFCHQSFDGTSCESAAQAKALFASALRFEGFNVVNETRTLSGLSSTRPNDGTAQKRLNNHAFSLDSLLEAAVKDAIDPGAESAKAPPRPPELTPDQIAELQRNRRAEHARSAVNNVVTLIASSLAQFTTPAHNCESERVITNWVQARGICQLNFRSETNHEFLCTENGVPAPIRATRRANINLASDVARITPIKVSEEGWASVVLELGDELRTTTEGSYKTNRWQFTTGSDQLEELKQLAGSLLTLKDYCQADG
ncbi:MAG: hypothetical protein WD002_04280 [Pseudomonadales bacterium]